MRTSRMMLLVVALVSCLVLSVEVALADKVYHSQHIDLMPVGGAPLRSGFVENIHVNGPQVFAHEVYVLNGAEPNTTYHVSLIGYLTGASSPNCSGTPALVLPTADLSTNQAGNGKAQVFFEPAQAEGLHGLTVSIKWTLTEDGATQPSYTTDCHAVTLD